MISQNFKDILSDPEYTGFYQTSALICLVLFFICLNVYVFTRPKKYYTEEAHAPLHKDE